MTWPLRTTYTILGLYCAIFRYFGNPQSTTDEFMTIFSEKRQVNIVKPIIPDQDGMVWMLGTNAKLFNLGLEKDLLCSKMIQAFELDGLTNSEIWGFYRASDSS